MPPKAKSGGRRKASAAKSDGAAAWSKRIWAAIAKRNPDIAEMVSAVVGGSPSFSTSEIRKVDRVVVSGNLQLGAYAQAVRIGYAMAYAQRVAKWVGAAAKGAPRAPSAAVSAALTALVGRNVSEDAINNLFGSEQNAGGGELVERVREMTAGIVPDSGVAVYGDTVLTDAIRRLYTSGPRLTQAQMKTAMEDAGATRALGALMRSIASAKSVASNTAPIPRNLRQAARGEVNGVPDCPAGYVPVIRRDDGNALTGMDNPIISHRDGSKSLRPGYEVVGCEPVRKLKGNFSAATISALVGDEGLAGLADIAPGQAFRAKKKPKRKVAKKKKPAAKKKPKRKVAKKKSAAAKKPKGKGFAKTSLKMPARVAIKGKSGKKKWVHRRVYRLTRNRPCEGNRKARAKGALFIKKSVKVPGTRKSRIVMLFVTKTDVARAKAALKRAKATKAKRKAAPQKRAKRTKASVSKARALLTSAADFEAKRRRKKKSRSSTAASRSAAAKKAWRKRRAKYGKSGLSRQYRASK